MSKRCPLYPRKRTLSPAFATSALCQKRTFRAAANSVVRARLGGSAQVPCAPGVHALCDRDELVFSSQRLCGILDLQAAVNFDEVDLRGRTWTLEQMALHRCHARHS
jgi:hypothetical protein